MFEQTKEAIFINLGGIQHTRRNDCLKQCISYTTDWTKIRATPPINHNTRIYQLFLKTSSKFVHILDVHEHQHIDEKKAQRNSKKEAHFIHKLCHLTLSRSIALYHTHNNISHPRKVSEVSAFETIWLSRNVQECELKTVKVQVIFLLLLIS